MSYGIIAYTSAGKISFKLDTRFTIFKQKITVSVAPGVTTSFNIPGIRDSWLVCLTKTPGFSTSNWLESYIVPDFLHILSQSWASGSTINVDILLFETRIL